MRPLGITLSLSYNVTEMPRDRMQVSRPDPDGRMGLARTLAEINTRERAGAGLKFDYRFDDVEVARGFRGRNGRLTLRRLAGDCAP